MEDMKMTSVTCNSDARESLVVHSLLDVPEEKRDRDSIGELKMNKSVKYSASLMQKKKDKTWQYMQEVIFPVAEQAVDYLIDAWCNFCDSTAPEVREEAKPD
jgi:hypothetical protein